MLSDSSRPLASHVAYSLESANSRQANKVNEHISQTRRIPLKGIPASAMVLESWESISHGGIKSQARDAVPTLKVFSSRGRRVLTSQSGFLV